MKAMIFHVLSVPLYVFHLLIFVVAVSFFVFWVFFLFAFVCLFVWVFCFFDITLGKKIFRKFGYIHQKQRVN